MNDIGQIVTAIQGNPIKREILGVEENNYVLTWSGVNDQWEAKSSGSDSNPGVKYNVKTINTGYSIEQT